MGYDTSHHPLDTDLITGRLVPFLLGEEEIDDLVADAVRISKVRFRANAWGLGAFRHLRDHEQPFDSDLYIWGRPFFVTVEGTTAIADAIDRYLAADVADVDLIAAEMLDHLDSSLVGVVKPSGEGQLPPDDELAASKRCNLDLLRTAVRQLDAGTPVPLGDGESADPAELLRRETIWAMTNFAAEFRPGWMDRGYVWPSAWTAEANLTLDVFESPRSLLGELASLHVDFFAPTGIVENYMVGALVTPPRVVELLAALREHHEALVGAWGDPNEYTRLSLRKLQEAAADALYRGLSFCEATEIYSGFGGTLN